jgi:hypothetical protein
VAAAARRRRRTRWMPSWRILSSNWSQRCCRSWSSWKLLKRQPWKQRWLNVMRSRRRQQVGEGAGPAAAPQVWRRRMCLCALQRLRASSTEPTTPRPLLARRRQRARRRALAGGRPAVPCVHGRLPAAAVRPCCLPTWLRAAQPGSREPLVGRPAGAIGGHIRGEGNEGGGCGSAKLGGGRPPPGARPRHHLHC